MKPGDLVQYISNPIGKPPDRPRVIPKNNYPVGIVIDIIMREIGEGECLSYLEIIMVKWSDIKWNSSTGFSEEFRSDLRVIQEV